MTKEELRAILFDIEDAICAGRQVTPKWLSGSVVECWQLLDCHAKRCPAFGRPGVRCWQVAGTFCSRHIVPAGRETRWKDCRECNVFQLATRTDDRRLRELLGNIVSAWGASLRRMGPAPIDEQLSLGVRANHGRLAGRFHLTPREMEVLALTIQHPRRKVAGMLCLSEEAVKMHVKHIYRKVGAHSKKQLMDRVGAAVQNRGRG
jgi:DNA-binding CsgD family transcriptional regulator